jgi:DNA modification methylase
MMRTFPNGSLYLGDCLEVMPHLSASSFDAVITDPPYGSTRCKWDAVIPLDRMWQQIGRLARRKAPTLLFASKPFSASVILSNLRDFRYDWIYEKTCATGHLNSKKMPLRAHEEILVFYRSLPAYFPQKTSGHVRKTATRTDYKTEIYNPQTVVTSYDSTERFPRSVLKYATEKQTLNLHPTQKPTDLLRYLIRTYTSPGDLILDFACGSGSTCAAAVLEGRRFVGIEKESKYFERACCRLADIGQPCP